MGGRSRESDKQRRQSSIAFARNVSLTSVFSDAGLERDKSDKKKYKSGEHSISANGDLWYDHKAAKGGKGAIDLHMHLTGQDFKTSVADLGGDLSPQQRMETANLDLIANRIKSQHEQRISDYQKQEWQRLRNEDDAQWEKENAYPLDTVKLTSQQESHVISHPYNSNHVVSANPRFDLLPAALKRYSNDVKKKKGSSVITKGGNLIIQRLGNEYYHYKVYDSKTGVYKGSYALSPGNYGNQKESYQINDEIDSGKWVLDK